MRATQEEPDGVIAVPAGKVKGHPPFALQ